MGVHRSALRCGRRWPALAAVALTLAAGGARAGIEPAPAPAGSEASLAAALADLGLALLRQPGPANAVVSPLATAAALGMVHAGTAGAAEHEIEALFGPRKGGARAFKVRLPALLKQLAGGPAAAPFVMAGRVWIDPEVAASVPAPYTQRLAARLQADAARLSFAEPEAARAQINAWTAEHSAGRITGLLPTGSLTPASQIVLTAAIHFRSPWEQPFDAAQTAPRSFNGAAGATVPTLVDERVVQQARVDGNLVLEVPFAGGAFALLVGVPAAGGSVEALLTGLSGSELARWRGALQPIKCELALPRFDIAPTSTPLKSALEGLGVKTVFSAAADLRPMLGRHARNLHLDDVHHAAGITIDERGGEAVAATAATVRAKSLALPVPTCAVERAFVFAVVHRRTGTPLFLGRVGDPARTQ
jgi:serpin B